MTGEVTADQLTRMLLGSDPVTGAVLVSSVGSAGRAARHRETPLVPVHAGETLNVQEAAARLGFDPSYVKRLLLATERNADDPQHHRQPLQPLHGVRDGNGRWQVASSEIDRFICARTEPKVVVGYDATFKWEKSISLAWVQADPATRRIIEDALDTGVRAGTTG